MGSEYYTQNLGPANSSVLRAYLNFDMVSRGYFGVFDGDGSSFNVSWPAGSDVIESLFVDDLTSKGIDVTPVKFSETSDYQWFFKLGFPTGGLHTGSDKAQDSCYHLPCDTYSNANSTILTINAKVRDSSFLPSSPAQSFCYGHIKRKPPCKQRSKFARPSFGLSFLSCTFLKANCYVQSESPRYTTNASEC